MSYAGRGDISLECELDESQTDWQKIVAKNS